MVGRREQGDGRTALEGIAEMRISQEARQGPGVALHEERDTGEGRALMENGRRGGGRGAGGGHPELGQTPPADCTAREEVQLNQRAERS